VRLSDKAQSRLARSPSYDGSYTWSPDGTRVAFISSRDGFDALYVVDADGGHLERLTATASLTPGWGSQR
jgi:TolB protein